MIERAVIVHGKPSREKYEASPTDPSDSNWIPWAKHQLHLNGVSTYTPDMPRPFEPDYATWKEEFTRYDEVEGFDAYIGFSAGASFLLRFISEGGEVIAPMGWSCEKLILVAPWLDLNKKYGDFSNFEIDPEIDERCSRGLSVFYSSLDDDQAKASLEVIQAALPSANYRNIPEYGHFMIGNTMKGPEFPELIKELL
jgi:predicted alpha/beta hydrolase family esterase